MLYALTDAETDKLRAVPTANRYEYMLDEIEEKLFGTARACELDKAWFSIQYCLGGGSWHEDDAIPYNIVFGGEFVISDIPKIISYNFLQIVLSKILGDAGNFFMIFQSNDFLIRVYNDFPYKDANGFEHALYWCNNIPVFYDNSQNNNYQVIFSVDL